MAVLLRVENVTAYHQKSRLLPWAKPRVAPALDGISFEMEEGKTTGIAGETGCGKTTLALTILRIHKAYAGAVYFSDRQIFRMGERRFRRMRGDLQMIYSNPNDSFGAGWTVRRLFQEVLELHQQELSRNERRDRAIYLLEEVGLDEECLKRFPAELSLFDRQRVAIARVLAAQPRLLICDDPTRYLDTVSQARVLDILKDIQVHWRISLLFLARDYAAVDHMSDYIHVMNRGRFVESGTPHDLYHSPKHDYTRQLLTLSGAP